MTSLIEKATSLAIVAASNEPLLFLTGDLRIIAASASFCRVFQIGPDRVVGRPLSEINSGEWSNPKLASLLKATASGAAEIAAYELDLDNAGRGARHLVVNASKLDDGDVANVRLLVAVSDVTAARADALLKDELIREKAVLLQEVQHRVANSLQIIASVLMQSARRVQSEEARGHLQDAHHRVMSIAAVQHHLAMSSLHDVALRPYVCQLCESLATSMISDPDALSMPSRSTGAWSTPTSPSASASSSPNLSSTRSSTLSPIKDTAGSSSAIDRTDRSGRSRWKTTASACRPVIRGRKPASVPASSKRSPNICTPASKCRTPFRAPR